MKEPKGTNDLFMRRALELAKRGGEKTRPNPRVGCVLVKDGKIIAEAWHKKFGGPHAEALALKKAGLKASGATAYITLEPCVAFPGKKTPSCAEALISANVKNVFISSKDPNPRISGRGINLLKKNGISVHVGMFERECEEINRSFFWRQRHQRPYVVLKLALSLDGKAFAAGGNSKWITGKPARNFVYGLRTRFDAILVGSETVIKDNPSLTSHGRGKNPLRLVLDTRLKIPQNSHVLTEKTPTLIITSSRQNFPRETLRVPLKNGRVDIKKALQKLAERGIETLLVEGGPKVCASFLKNKIVDEAYLFFAPKFLSEAKNPNHSPILEDPQLEKIGKDFLIHGRIRY